MPSIRINKVIRDLNVGLPSVVEFLRKKGSEIDENPNSKISAEELKMLVHEFCKDKSKEERDALIAKYTAPKEVGPKVVTEVPKQNTQADVAPKIEPASDDSKGGLKIKGYIDLDAKKPTPKPAPAKEEASVEQKEAKPEPAKEVPQQPKEQPKVQEPKVTVMEEKKATVTPPPPPAHVAEEKPKVVEKKEETPKVSTSSDRQKEEVTKEEKTSKDAPEAKEEDSNIFRLKSETPTVGVKVVGVVDLSTLGNTGRGSKSNEKGRKKRNRIGGAQKVDVSKVQVTGDEKKDKHPKDKNAARPPKQEVGRKAKRKQAAPPPKPEVTQEDIQKQIKETLAQMQSKKNKGTAQAAKYRKDKREAHRREQDELEKMQSEDRTLRLTEYVTANDLAQMIDIPVNDIIMLCFNLGMMVSINQRLEKETIDLILDEYGYEPVYVEAQVLDAIQEEEDNEEDLLPRAPIVTVMGHVDHGKTSLLDSIRNTDVISGEAGGITQHVGAYSVKLKNGRKLTFLDTPGHEAFTAMRARGAKVTDIVIIVVAADDGVMPQTKEAINHASLAGVPIIFAINKVDKPHANPEKIKEELANLNYLVEDWGGKYQSQEISAKKGTGIYELLEKVLLEADILELKANPNKRAAGTVLESTMEVGRGYTTKVLIHEGTLRVGDHILAGIHYGRVKALFNERGANVESVGPSDPVKVLGLNGAVQAGEAFNVLETEQEVREIASKRTQLKREQRERTQRIPTLESLGQRIAEGKVQELNVIVKGDVDGSVEALSDSIVKLSTDEIRVNVIHKAVGQISDSDVILASASDAVIIGFQVRPAASARRLAENEGVEIRTYSIIYTALDDVKQAMEGMLSPEIKERVTANLEVRETFRITKVGTIAGCVVKDGKISRTDKVRVIRDGIVVFSGALGSLKRFKDDVKEVGNGFECGLNIDNFNDIAVGDIIEAYEEFEVKKKL
ncbi:translation initiation factor IF-2 [Porphyromonas cangingivalis]|uniref:Translation initiation factor IF-2 n=1 Tax=Porphyromonas cangingivalis TaxID=36874 RepID=A0A0A2ETY7_PORCN|nr:translation initiation factor IF-2 [Porphyromonas cangingivalis]KGN80950.1 translation initiation factor IF-2 [Porphyromonas cangingivalis]